MSGFSKCFCSQLISVMTRVKRQFTDKDICHFYLCGMCPYEEFERTKHDVGPCPLLHDEDLRADWQVRLPTCASWAVTITVTVACME